MPSRSVWDQMILNCIYSDYNLSKSTTLLAVEVLLESFLSIIPYVSHFDPHASTRLVAAAAARPGEDCVYLCLSLVSACIYLFYIKTSFHSRPLIHSFFSSLLIDVVNSFLRSCKLVCCCWQILRLSQKREEKGILVS